jgi:hypothetical protein
MSIDKTIKEIKEYKDLFEKEKENMSELERIMFSPDALDLCSRVLELFKKSRNE